jgi:hypothetical protein
MLWYSGLDTAGWLVASNLDKGVKASFTAFADAYVLPEVGLECMALELYGAGAESCTRFRRTRS